jgi:hypothetical protein
MSGVKGALRKEMSVAAIEKLVKRWGNPVLKASQPKNLTPYARGGIFLPSQKGGIPHETGVMKDYFRVARDLYPQWQSAVTAAFVALKELANGQDR